MIRFADKRDIPELKNIWKRGFLDDDKTVDAFFGEAWELCRCLCRCDGNKPVAAMYIFDCELICGEKTYKAAYLYALSTLPEYRNRGIMSQLIQSACDTLCADGYEYALLAPADDNLSEYYKKLGFLPVCMAKCADIPADCIFDFALETHELTPDSLADMRCARKGDTVRFDSRYVGFALGFCGLKAISFDGGYAVYEPDESVTRIIEYGGDENRVLSAVKWVQKSGVYRIFMPPEHLLGEAVCRGMVRPLCGREPEQNIHIGLIMD